MTPSRHSSKGGITRVSTEIRKMRLSLCTAKIERDPPRDATFVDEYFAINEFVN